MQPISGWSDPKYEKEVMERLKEILTISTIQSKLR